MATDEAISPSTQAQSRVSRGFRATSRPISPGRLERMWRLLGLSHEQWDSYFGVSGKVLCKLNPTQTEADWWQEVEENLEEIKSWKDYQ